MGSSRARFVLHELSRCSGQKVGTYVSVLEDLWRPKVKTEHEPRNVTFDSPQVSFFLEVEPGLVSILHDLSLLRWDNLQAFTPT
jgi:hypothetical protein